MNYREKMREFIKSPRDGSSIHYGKWCALNQEQTNYITRLLNEMDRADEYIKKLFLERGTLQQENKQLKEEIEKYKTTIEIYQPYFKGIDLVKEIEKMQELENGDIDGIKS